jgi:hypothetical protein
MKKKKIFFLFKKAFDDAIAELDTLNEDTYKGLNELIFVEI